MWHTKNQLPRLGRTKSRSPSICKKNEVVFHLKKNMEVVFHILSCSVKIRLHTENQLPGLAVSALKVSLGVLVGNQVHCHSQLELRLSWAVTILLSWWSLDKSAFSSKLSQTRSIYNCFTDN